MNWDNKLISKCAQHGGVARLIASGIDARHFSDNESKEVWQFMSDHIKRYKGAPSFEVIKDAYPEYEYEIVPDSLEFIKDKFITDAKVREAKLAAVDVLEAANDIELQPLIDEIFLDKAKDLAKVIPSSRTSKFSSMQERIELYKERKEEGKSLGVPFGIKSIDDLTFGIQPHQLVTIAGWTGIGKSSLALFLMMNAYDAGYTPMMFSLEMDEEQIYRKLDAMALNIRQMTFKGMSLTDQQLEQWEQYAEKVSKAASDLIIIDLDEATPEKVYSEAARWSPDIIAVDYLQLMRAPNYLKQGWEKVGHLAKEMKQLARQLKIPVYALSQTNSDSSKEGARLDNLSQARAIGAHSDIVLGLQQDEEMREEDCLEVRVLKNRDGPKKDILLKWKPDTMQFSPWGYAEVFPTPKKNPKVKNERS